MTQTPSPKTTSTICRNTITCGDALTVMKTLPTGSIDQIFFSPPYFRLRHYGVGAPKGELGQETTINQWIDNLFAICREAKRLLTPTGGLWLNLGDSYSDHPRRGANRKSLLLGPERLALQLIKDSWLLRGNIIWAKSNHLPCSSRDRLASAWEHLYFLTPNPNHFFDLDAIRQPHTTSARAPHRPRWDKRDTRRPAGRHDQTRPKDPRETSHHTCGLADLKASGLPGHPLGKNPGDVWTIPTSNQGTYHSATMPIELARRAIAAGCPEQRCAKCHAPYAHDPSKTRQIAERLGYTGIHTLAPRPNVPLQPTCTCTLNGDTSEPGLVLDPFIGSGTTALAAKQLGRDWLGIELKADYVRYATTRITNATETEAR